MKEHHKSKVAEFVLSFLGLFLFSISVGTITHELRQYSWTEIISNLADISKKNLGLALTYTLIGDLAISCYDWLGFYYLKVSLSPVKILFTSFVSYIISNNVGLAILTGSAIRYRLYSHWSVSGKTITKIVALGNLSFWVGIMSVCGLIFTIEPLTFPNILNMKVPLHINSLKPLGIFCLVMLSFYLLGSFFHHTPIKIKNIEIPFPPLKISLSQIALSVLDWGLAIAVLYLLLPTDISVSYVGFAGIYLSAMVLGIISNIPGGLGVFESVIIVSLEDQISPPELLGSLLAYRVIYYFIPLILATSCLGVYEIHHRWLKR